jgi:hypothetical protein
MCCKSIIRAGTLFIIVLCFISPDSAFCQDAFEKALAKKVDSLLAPVKAAQLFPDDAIQAITTPTGFGGYGTYIFGNIGGIYPQVYSKKADLIASGGVSIGNPVKAINFAASVNMGDVSEQKDFSYNFILSKVIFAGSSISVGALQMFSKSGQTDVPGNGNTYYFAFSHAVQTLPSATPGSSKLTYTLGIGNGRFYLKSPDDVNARKPEYGTAVFGGISYEIIHHINLNAEWDGTNLGTSIGIRPFKAPLSIGLGAVNLTPNSGDRPSMVFSIGYPLSLSRQTN